MPIKYMILLLIKGMAPKNIKTLSENMASHHSIEPHLTYEDLLTIGTNLERQRIEWHVTQLCMNLSQVFSIFCHQIFLGKNYLFLIRYGYDLIIRHYCFSLVLKISFIFFAFFSSYCFQPYIC